jgi:hypothetical protein
MISETSIPPGLLPLFEGAGPVLRYRLMRDVLRRDDSYIHTAHLALDLPKLPEVQALIAAQEMDGTWGGTLCGWNPKLPQTAAEAAGPILCTETALLRLCELGCETNEAVRACLEKSLLPTLLNDDLIWELESLAIDDASRRAVRRIVRDKVLRLITRATREYDDLLKPIMELVLIEWEQSLHGQELSALPPTADAYAAVCWYPWSEDDFPRVRGHVLHLGNHAETQMGQPAYIPEWFLPHTYQLCDKWEYLNRPDLFFHELELAARFGVTPDLAVTRWLLSELEMRQDADGFTRFAEVENVPPSWYFPLESAAPEVVPREWSFRAALIYALVEYDL